MIERNRKLLADTGNADKLAAAHVPALAARFAPQDFRADVNRVSLLGGNRDFQFLAERQVRIVQQSDAGFGDFAAET